MPRGGHNNKRRSAVAASLSVPDSVVRSSRPRRITTNRTVTTTWFPVGGVPFRVVATVMVLAAALLWYWNQRAIWNQREAPLDHIGTVFLKPLWAWTCPAIIITDDLVKRDAKNYDDSTTGISTTPTKIIPIVMISARPAKQVRPVYQTWSQNTILLAAPTTHRIRFTVQLFNTSKVSRMHNVGTRCRNVTFASRLFAVYQHVIQTVLGNDTAATALSSHVVIVEDDTLLMDAHRFVAEVAWAVRNDAGFYSFPPFDKPDLYGNITHPKSDAPINCVYQYSTTASVYSRSIMQIILDASVDSVCRLPIDMFIAREGPWYASVHRVTHHLAKRMTFPSSSAPTPPPPPPPVQRRRRIRTTTFTPT